MKTLILLLLTIGGSLGAVAQFESPPNEILVMSIDTGIAPHSKLTPYVKYQATDDYKDNNEYGHGTHVAGIIAYGNRRLNDPLCNKVKIISCKYYDPNIPNPVQKATDCIKLATKLKVDYINYSGGGTSYNLDEYFAVKEFTERGGVLVTAAGNKEKVKGSYKDVPFFSYFPAYYSLGFTHSYQSEPGKIKRVQMPALRNVLVVENFCRDGKLCDSSNMVPLATRELGDEIISTSRSDDGYAKMSGTSQATPAILHTILKQRCKEF